MLSMDKLFDRNATEHLNLGKNGFDMMAFMIKYEFTTGKSEIFEIPKSIGEIRMMSMINDRGQIPVVKKVPRVPCKERQIGFYTEVN